MKGKKPPIEPSEDVKLEEAQAQMKEGMIPDFIVQKFFKMFLKSDNIKIEINEPEKKKAVVAFSVLTQQGMAYGRVCVQGGYYDNFMKTYGLDEVNNDEKKKESGAAEGKRA